MSGGHYEYSQFCFENDFVNPFEKQLEQWEECRKKPVENVEEAEWNQWFAHSLSDETMKEFRKAVVIMKMAVAYAQRIDWFISGDDCEESFLKRLKEDLEIATILKRDITDQFTKPQDGKKIKVFEAKSKYCRCTYAMGYDDEGYNEWITIYSIETVPEERRKHHADRMIKYLKKDFWGKPQSSVTLNEASKNLMKKHKIFVYHSDNTDIKSMFLIKEPKQ